MKIDGTSYALALLVSALLSSTMMWVGIFMIYDKKFEVMPRDMDLYFNKGGAAPLPIILSKSPAFETASPPRATPGIPAREEESSRDFEPLIAALTDESTRILEIYGKEEHRGWNSNQNFRWKQIAGN